MEALSGCPRAKASVLDGHLPTGYEHFSGISVEGDDGGPCAK